MTQNNLFPGRGVVHFHQDPPHHLIYSDTLYAIQVCVMLTPFTKDNGATIYLDKDGKENGDGKENYITGNIGDVYYWPAMLLHSEGVNKTNETRSCLIMNIQSIASPRINFLLGEDKPILTFCEQYKNANLSFDYFDIVNDEVIVR